MESCCPRDCVDGPSKREGQRSQPVPVKIFNNYVHRQIFALSVIEFALIVASVYIGAGLRFGGDFSAIYNSIGLLWPRALLIAGVVFLTMVALGLYHARLRPRRTGIVVRLILSFLVSGAALILLFYLFPSLYVGRGALLLAMIIAFLLVSTVRIFFFTTVDEKIFKRRVIVYGTGEKASSILSLRRRADQRGFFVVGFVAPNDNPSLVSPDRILPKGKSLEDLAEEYNVDEIVVAIDDRRKGLAVQELLDCKLNGIQITEALTFFERETGKVKLDLLYPSWLIFSEGFTRPPARIATQRFFDVLVALIVLFFTWPIMLAVAIAIWLEDGFDKPVLYRQKRVGYKGTQFEVLKFRSMRVDAESDGVAKWAEKDDSRITRVGSVIRKYRIDELPQLFNVLRGQMSFVGPRPERPDFVEELGNRIPYYRERHCVKPGITGWAQLCYEYGSTQQDALEKLQYDLYYVKNHNLLFDLLILLQTAEVVLWKAGAR